MSTVFALDSIGQNEGAVAYILGLVSLIATVIALAAVTIGGASQVSLIALAIFYVAAFYALARICQGHEANKLSKQIVALLKARDEV